MPSTFEGICSPMLTTVSRNLEVSFRLAMTIKTQLCLGGGKAFNAMDCLTLKTMEETMREIRTDLVLISRRVYDEVTKPKPSKPSFLHPPGLEDAFKSLKVENQPDDCDEHGTENDSGTAGQRAKKKKKNKKKGGSKTTYNPKPTINNDYVSDEVSNLDMQEKKTDTDETFEPIMNRPLVQLIGKYSIPNCPLFDLIDYVDTCLQCGKPRWVFQDLDDHRHFLCPACGSHKFIEVSD